jgi:Phage tail assembly chaperone protein
MANIICVIDTTSNTIVSKFIKEKYPDQTPSPTQIYVPCPSLLVDSFSKDDNGNWIFTTSQDLEIMYWNKLREDRNALLTRSDWTQFSDSPLTLEQKAAWATYRQQLRDLPANTPDPSQVTWPTPPTN